MLIHEEERFLGIAFFLQPSQSLICDNIGSVSNMLANYDFPILVHRLHRRILVRTLPDQHVEMVVTLRRRREMPFSNNGSLITFGPKQLRKGLLATIEMNAVPIKPIQVTVFSSLNDRSAWSANRIRHVITRKPHAFIRNPIHIGSRYIARIISAQSLLTVIIRKDEKNVRSFLSRFAGNYSSIGKENQ